MKSTASAVLLLALAGVSLSSAFVPVSNRPGHVTFMATDDAEIDSSTEGAAAEEAAAGEAPPKPAVKCPDCDKCDGSGRILGGIPTILPWWPIKPYRPCPNFIERGGRYVRSGQALDEIAFGRDSTYKPDGE